MMVKEMEYLPQPALAVDKYEDACAIQKVLLENGYVTMMGREESLWTLNWIYSEYADRNDVIFIERGLYEMLEDERNRKGNKE